MGFAAIIGVWLLALLPGLSNRPWSTPLSLLSSAGDVPWVPMLFAALLTGMQQALAVRWWFARRRWWAVVTQSAAIALVVCGATPPHALVHDIGFVAAVILTSFAMIIPWIGLRQRQPVAWFLIVMVLIGVLISWPAWGLGGFQRAGFVVMLAALSWHWHVTAVHLPIIRKTAAVADSAVTGPVAAQTRPQLRRRPPLHLSVSPSGSPADTHPPLRLVPRLAPNQQQALSLWSEADRPAQRSAR
jgi:hypothetical protein